ncbi:MAG TPA: hypothetical protein VG479_07940 [Gaiellaceae bacterium]|jgi:hypothetical protein|nr:hypothetical protein [Gaiellaceae bacterium]
MSETASTVDSGDRETLALKVGAGGAVAFLAGLVLGSKLLRVAGLGAALVGGGLYAREQLVERGEKISAAETRIRSELDDLDPVARAQVVKDLAEPDG